MWFVLDQKKRVVVCGIIGLSTIKEFAQGRIIKALASFYYVEHDGVVYQTC